jgi:hypothetical protein
MAKLLISTQTLENYGSPEQPHWKAKGGVDYVVRNVTDFNAVQALVDQVTPEIEQANDMFREWIITWEIVEDDFLTQFEKDQLEYEGSIQFPAHEISVKAA